MYPEIEEEIATLKRQMLELIRKIEDRLEQREYSTLVAESLRRSVSHDHIR